MELTLDRYAELLLQFKYDGYSIYPVGKIELPEPKLQILLRHDVDFDVFKALQMAEAEKEIGIQSSFYFLIRSHSYNFLSPIVQEIVKKIKALNHDIGLHFDASIYKNVKTGLLNEIEIFENITKTKVSFITIHRPSKIFTKDNKPIGNIRHSYEKKFFQEIGYYSDSGGSFKYGLPQDDPKYKEGNSFQLLTHPIWWTTAGSNEIEKLQFFQKERKNYFSKHISENCIPWRKYLEKNNP